mgnify:CR=1 FL=1
MATWYARKTGSDSNGGSSSSASADRTGTDGVTTIATPTFTSLTASFAAGDVGKGINVNAILYRIAAFVDSTTVTLDRNAAASGTGLTWNIGGALLTIGKMLGLSAQIMQNGDTFWIGGGVYRETVTIAATTFTAETFVYGDVDGAQTGDAGLVCWSAYTTNDKTTPAAASALDLGGRDFLTIQDITFIGGNISGGCVNDGSGDTTNCTFRRCVFISGAVAGSFRWIMFTANVAINLTVDSCTFLTPAAPSLYITVPSVTGADWDVNVQVKNCMFITSGNGTGITFENSGALANKGGGLDAYNCTFIGGATAFRTITGASTSIPCTLYNSICYGQNTACVSAQASGQITEDYNVLLSSTARTNVTAGANSQAGNPFPYAPLFELCQAVMSGGQLRQFASPMLTSPFLGFGNQAGGPTVDMLNLPRPSGPGPTWANALNSIGCFERGNTAIKETTTVHTGSNALKMVGPATHSFTVPVNAAATTIQVFVQWDSDYTGTKPSMKVNNGTEAGVSDATATATGLANAWEKLSLTFTPTAAGFVTVNFISSSTAGNGDTYWDSFAGGSFGADQFNFYRRGEPFPSIVSFPVRIGAGGFVG